MSGIVISCKTTKSEQDAVIEAWWQGIQGSKSDALKRLIYKALTGDGGGNQEAPKQDPPEEPITPKVMKKMLKVLKSLDRKLSIETAPSLHANGNGHVAAEAPPDDRPLPRAKRPTRHNGGVPAAVTEPEQAEADDENVLAEAAGNFLNTFG